MSGASNAKTEIRGPLVLDQVGVFATALPVGIGPRVNSSGNAVIRSPSFDWTGGSPSQVARRRQAPVDVADRRVDVPLPVLERECPVAGRKTSTEAGSACGCCAGGPADRSPRCSAAGSCRRRRACRRGTGSGRSPVAEDEGHVPARMAGRVQDLDREVAQLDHLPVGQLQLHRAGLETVGRRVVAALLAHVQADAVFVAAANEVGDFRSAATTSSASPRAVCAAPPAWSA